TLVVQPAVASLVLAPAQATVAAGTEEPFTAEAYDAAGDDLGDATAQTTFTIDGAGTCSANLCGARLPGTYEVTGRDGAAASEATLVVQPGPVASLVLAPAGATIVAGQTNTYTAEGFDSVGNDLGDVTPDTIFAIDGSGHCDADVCGASARGVYTVT